MKKTHSLLYLSLCLFLLVACKKDGPAKADPAKAPEDDTIENIKKDEDQDATEAIKLVLGTHKGKGTYEYDNETSPDKLVSSIKIERKDNETIRISSPENIFPDFEVQDLVNQLSTVAGKPSNGAGAFMYGKAQKEVKVLIKQFVEEKTVLRFGN